MKVKISCSIIFVLVILSVGFSATPVHALAVGGPAGTVEAGKTSLTGALGYSSFEVDDTDLTSKSFMFKGAFGGSPGVTPYLKLGFADLKVDDSSFEGSLDFAFGGGVTLGLLRPQSESGLEIALDTQLLWWDSKDGSAKLDIFHGQVALLGAMKGGGTDPYAGIATNFITVDDGGNDFKESGKAHLFFGVDYYMDYNFFFNLEAHMFNENTVSLGVGYLF
jgi:hypothetical protein